MPTTKTQLRMLQHRDLAAHLQDVVARVEGELGVEHRRPHAKSLQEQPHPHPRIRRVDKYEDLRGIGGRG